MISLTLAPSSAALAGRSFTANSSHRSKLSTLNQRTHRNVTRANIVDAGYLLADAADKVADKANKVVGSVDAPGWVLPVSAVAVALILTASSLLLKPGVEAQEKMAERDAKRWKK